MTVTGRPSRSAPATESRQPVAPDSTPLETILAGKDALQPLGGLSRTDRLERAWLSGVTLKFWYFGEDEQVADLPTPPAKVTVWGYVVPGQPVRWARRKAAYLKAVRLHSGPRADFEFCSQTELRAFCLGIAYTLMPTEIS